MTVSRLFCVLAAVVIADPGGGSAHAQAPSSPTITVFAASDLGPPLKHIVPQFEQTTKTRVTLVLGSTGMLSQQIRNGAPADVFFAANESFIDELAAENLTRPASHTVYARGRIVMVALKSSDIRIAKLTDLADSRVGRIAIANPRHAPYGMAAREALEAAGIWNTVETRLVFGENVQQAVQFVRSGSAQAGLVARSLADTPDLQWTLIDERLHAPLNQMAAVTARTKQPGLAMSFIEFVNGARGRIVLRQFGFLAPGESF